MWRNLPAKSLHVNFFEQTGFVKIPKEKHVCTHIFCLAESARMYKVPFLNGNILAERGAVW